jgi:hypothetical protein
MKLIVVLLLPFLLLPDTTFKLVFSSSPVKEDYQNTVKKVQFVAILYDLEIEKAEGERGKGKGGCPNCPNCPFSGKYSRWAAGGIRLRRDRLRSRDPSSQHK